jgi:hypothetical protein
MNGAARYFSGKGTEEYRRDPPPRGRYEGQAACSTRRRNTGGSLRREAAKEPKLPAPLRDLINGEDG